MGMLSVVCVPLACVTFFSCTLLFDGTRQAAPEDAGADSPDAREEAGCKPSISLVADGELLNLERGQAIDIDRDGRDEVLLHSTDSQQRSRVFVHNGRCPVGEPWAYQQEWLPRLVSDEAPLRVHAAGLAAGRLEPDRLVVVGDSGDDSWFAAFPVEGAAARLPQLPDVEEALPQRQGAGGCEDEEAPYFLSVGNFDVDTDATRNDVVFAGRQTWLYSVEQWGSAPAWDVLCAGDGGSIPQPIAGPGSRYGILALEEDTVGAEEFVVARRQFLEWNFEGSRDDFSWPMGDVLGTALGTRGHSGDAFVDAVAWNTQSINDSLQLGAAVLVGRAPREVSFSAFELDLGGVVPTSGALLGGGAESGADPLLLLLVANELHLVEGPFEGTPTTSTVSLPFQPRFLVTPNWGQDSSPVVLVFDSDDASHECYQIEGGQLVPCAL